MNCPKCNSIIEKENAKFCPKCGFNLSTQPEDAAAAETAAASQAVAAPAAAANVPNVQSVPRSSVNSVPAVKVKLSVPVIIILALIPVLIAGFFAFKFITAPPSPEKVVDGFLKSLKSEDYEKAYSYLDDSMLIGNEFLTLEDFKSTFSNAKVTDFRYTVDRSSETYAAEEIERLGKKADKKFIESSKSFAVTLVENSDNVQLTINTMGKYMNGKKLKVLIDPSPFLTTTTIGVNSSKFDVLINNKKVVVDNEITLPMFQYNKVHVKITGDNIKPIEQDMLAGESFYSSDRIEPSDEAIEAAKKQIEAYNKRWFDGIKNGNLSAFEGLIEKDSSAWYEVQRQMTDTYTLSLNSQFVSMESKEAYFEDYSDTNKIVIDVDENWIDSYYTTGVTYRWTYSLAKHSDGKWYIYNCYRRWY